MVCIKWTHLILNVQFLRGADFANINHLTDKAFLKYVVVWLVVVKTVVHSTSLISLI